METKVLFSERQRFQPWWFWLFILATNALLLWVAFSRLLDPESSHNSGIWYVLLFWLIVSSALLWGICLDTEIRADGIYIRHRPYHSAFEKYAWEELSKVFVRQYNPTGEYGGWGWGRQFGRNSSRGKAFNVSGNQGLQLVLTDGTKLLIGTLQPDELKAVLVSMGHYVE